MATAAAPPLLDLGQEIKIDHDNVRELFARFQSSASASDAEKAKLVHTLVREVTVHCQAEELVLYKAYKDHGMQKEMEQDRDGHVKMDKMFAYIDSIKPNAPHFDHHVTESVELFLKHSDEEEQVLPMLLSKISADENARITREFLKARTTVPLHPHPSSPHSGGFPQKLFNTFEKVSDKMMQVFEGKREYVAVAQTHAAF